MAGSRAARSLLFSRWFSGLLAPARHKTLLFSVFCCICVSGLACGLLFLGSFFLGLWRARARPHVSLLGWGPAVNPAKGGALTTPPLPESCRAARSTRIASRALWSVVSLAESAAFAAYEASSVASALEHAGVPASG